MTTPSSQLHSLLLLLLLPVILAGAADEQPPMPHPGCIDKCGDISIPFPFGIGPGCFREGFEVLCNHSRAFLADDGTTILDSFFFNGSNSESYYNSSRVELVSISVATGEARAYAPVSYICINGATNSSNQPSISSSFAVSMTRNVLIGVGYSAEARLTFDQVRAPISCICSYNYDDPTNGSCTGVGCCTQPAPIDIGSSHEVFFSVDYYDGPLDRPPIVDQCSYGMLVEKSWYVFSKDDLDSNTLLKRFPRGVPFVLDFAAGDTSCPAEGQPPPPDYACVSANSYCANTTSNTEFGGGVRYICKCLEHYDGNPYLPNGCQDIDECKQPQVYTCSNGGICKNRLEGYDCPCKSGMKQNEEGTCTEKFPLPAKVAVGVVGGVSTIVVLVLFVLFLTERKRMREFFIKNGGPILEKINSIKIFKEDELKRITENYSHILGNGAFGVVYKGFLDDKQPVAVKKSKHSSKAQKDQFANEVIIQSRVIHKNIVRLIGCCLEVDVPLLVYEFVSNGNLEDALHGKGKVPLTMDQRIVIAAESAEGLAYMHSKTSTNIQHGDVKPANILLDDSYVPKISDFGISRLIARSNDQLTDEEVTGDNNYMDPVYRETGLLTNKSDVYSFGLVLYEIITGSRANCVNDCSMVINHLESYKKINTTNVRSYIQLKQDKDTELLQGLAEIARECLYRDVDQRPEMTDAAERLQNIRKWYATKLTSP